MPPISAFIITYNNADEIERCLRSIDWVDEIICIDSYSTDGTQEICRRFGAKVITQEFPGYYKQLKFAESQCTHDWALNLYADETVSPELREEIRRIFNGAPAANGYEMPRRNYFHKRWIHTAGYYPSLHLRLFRRSQGGNIPRYIHQKIKVNGKVGRLRGAIDHWCWAKEGELIDNLNEYAFIEAVQMTEAGRRVRPYHFLLPVGNFLKRYVIKRGFMQGYVGLIASLRPACLQAVRYMLAWEMQNRERLDTPDSTWLSGQISTGPELESARADEPLPTFWNRPGLRWLSRYDPSWRNPHFAAPSPSPSAGAEEMSAKTEVSVG